MWVLPFLLTGVSSDCVDYGDDCNACISAGCDLCVVEGTKVLYSNDFEFVNENQPWQSGYGDCDFMDYSSGINALWGGQGELGVIFCQQFTVEGIKHEIAATPDDSLDPAKFGQNGVGFLSWLNQDILGAYFPVDPNETPYLMIEFDASMLNVDDCCCTGTNAGEVQFTLSVMDGDATNDCAVNNPLHEVTVTGKPVGDNPDMYQWETLRAMLDITGVTQGAVTILFNSVHPNYNVIDNLRILSSELDVEIPTTATCAEPNMCGTDTSDTITVVETCPCQFLSSDCRNGECLLNSNCAFCIDGCCDDFAPGAYDTCPDCGVPSGLGYDFEGGGTQQGDEQQVTCASGYGGPDQVITCEQSGEWTPFVGCELGNCGSPTTDQAGLVFGSGGSTVGDTRSTYCEEGFSSSGDDVVTCGDDLLWTSVNTVCSPVECGPAPLNTGLTTDATCQGRFPDVCIGLVAPGFEGLYMGMLSCDFNGEWDVDDSGKFDALMEYLEVEIQWLAFMNVDFVKEAVIEKMGDVFTDEQYQIIFDILDGNFDGKVYEEEVAVAMPLAWTTEPTRVSCDPPTEVVEGHTIGEGGDLFEDTREVTCNDGFEGTPVAIVCQSDATWSSVTGCVPAPVEVDGASIQSEDFDDAGMKASVKAVLPFVLMGMSLQ
jgi:hypothetical protein